MQYAVYWGCAGLRAADALRGSSGGRPAHKRKRTRRTPGSRARGLLLLLRRCLRAGGVRVDSDDEHDGNNDVIIHFIIIIAAKQTRG